LKIALSVWV